MPLDEKDVNKSNEVVNEMNKSNEVVNETNKSNEVNKSSELNVDEPDHKLDELNKLNQMNY